MTSIPPVSDSVASILAGAKKEAHRLQHEYIGTEHVLLAIVHSSESDVVALRSIVHLDVGTIEDRIGEAVHRGTSINAKETPYTSRTQQALSTAVEEAGAEGIAHIEPRHLLLGLLADRRSIATVVMEVSGMTLDGAREALGGRP